MTLDLDKWGIQVQNIAMHIVKFLDLKSHQKSKLIIEIDPICVTVRTSEHAPDESADGVQGHLHTDVEQGSVS